MKIKQKLNQHRRDFTAIYVCGHCGHELESRGYDDAYFHETVIPGMKCPECGESDPASSTPDVPAGVQL